MKAQQETKGRVLVIEDDRDISLGIRTVLARNGFNVASSADGKEGLRAFHVSRPDLVVLDIGLPTLDGWTVLERIRDLSDVPVLILTAHGNEADKVRGLHAGADDYLTKPFGNSELAARVEALLRRPRADQEQPEVYDDGRLLVKFGSREVSVGGAQIALTPTEFRLLAALIRHPGQTLTPEQLLKLAWNDPLGVGPERVKFTIMRLRRKLDQDVLDTGAGAGRPGSAVEAVRGFGYRYVARRTDPKLAPGTATVLHRAGNRVRQAARAHLGHEH
jgi:DNA-binding response OmpR family regulator